MSDNANWVTIEQAAVTLGLSVRTITRHINAGKLQSRLTDGRREVLLDSAAPKAVSGGPIVINDAAGGHDADEVIDYETVLALADNAADKADLAVSAYQTLAHTAHERARGNRRISAVAWSVVGLMTLGIIGSIGWASHHITRASVEQRHLQQQVDSAAIVTDTLNGECDDLRRALAAAREDAARAEGRLAAYSEPKANASDASATTRPSLADRIASIFE